MDRTSASTKWGFITEYFTRKFCNINHFRVLTKHENDFTIETKDFYSFEISLNEQEYKHREGDSRLLGIMIRLNDMANTEILTFLGFATYWNRMNFETIEH